MSKTTKSIILILISAFAFACMNLFVRLSGDLPTMQKAFFRNSVSFVVALIALRKNRISFKVSKKAWGAMIIRAVAGTIGVICSFYAVDTMPIADASMLNKLSPFFTLIFSFFLLREKPSKFDWIAIVIAFSGALFIIRPELGMDALPAIAGVLGGVGAGLAYTYVRKASLCGASKHLIILVFSFVSCLTSVPYLIVAFEPMTFIQVFYLLCAGGAATVGQLCLTTAYAQSPAKDISVFEYSIVIFAAILSIIFLQESSSYMSYIGYAIIIGVAAAKWIISKKQDKGLMSESSVIDNERLDKTQCNNNEKM